MIIQTNNSSKSQAVALEFNPDSVREGVSSCNLNGDTEDSGRLIDEIYDNREIFTIYS